nr:23S rRNA (pseudouridine(1915)-N(3))-methyltransferase RlmH [Oceanococcus sp. HetDA_MAG_MS8]
MKLRIIVVATPGPRWADDAGADFLQRLPKHWKTQLQWIKPTAGRERSSAQKLKVADSDKVRKLLQAEPYVLLDERGQHWPSRRFAEQVQRWDEQYSQLNLVIGGPDGHDQALRDGAAGLLALSKLTFPHALARVVLLEQLYRASAILAQHPYHRD